MSIFNDKDGAHYINEQMWEAGALEPICQTTMTQTTRQTRPGINLRNQNMQSENINELASALAKAQGAITGALKDSANPFFKSKYADLASCWDACRTQLSSNGLAVIQTTSLHGIPLGENLQEVTLVVETILAHSSGQWIKSITPVKAKDDGPQAQGSGITYARRYALAAMVGLAQIDDDAEAAQARDKPAGRTLPPEPKIDTKAVNKYVQLINDANTADKESVMADLMREAKDVHEEFAGAVWSSLSMPVKNRLRDISNRKAA